MSRNDLFLLLACAIVATVLSGPSPLARSSTLTLASLMSPAASDGAASDPALFQQSFNRQ